MYDVFVQVVSNYRTKGLLLLNWKKSQILLLRVTCTACKNEDVCFAAAVISPLPCHNKREDGPLLWTVDFLRKKFCQKKKKKMKWEKIMLMNWQRKAFLSFHNFCLKTICYLENSKVLSYFLIVGFQFSKIPMYSLDFRVSTLNFLWKWGSEGGPRV